MDTISITLFIKTCITLILITVLSACVSPNEKFEATSTMLSHDTDSYLEGNKLSLRKNLLTGKLYHAHYNLENDTIDSRNVFTFMNRGMLRRMTGDYVGSNQSFENAKKLIDSLYGISISEKLGAAAFSDVVTSYAGHDYERTLLHMYMAMNYLQLNDYSAARVEVLQADLFMAESTKNDALVRYLSGLIFYALGEYDQAIVEYRKAITAYNNEKSLGLISAVPQDLIEDFIILLSNEGLDDEADQYRKKFSSSYSSKHEKKYRRYKNNKNYGELVVILNFGVTPAKIDTTFLDKAKNIFIKDKPENESHDSYMANSNRIKANSPDFSVNLTLMKDVSALTKIEQTDLTGTNFRIFSKMIENSNKQLKTNSALTMNSYFEYVKKNETEVADKRSWTSLPNKILMQKLLLPIGEYDIGIVMPNEHGNEEYIAKTNVSVSHGNLIFSSLHAMPPIPDEILRKEARLGNTDAQYKLAKRLEKRLKITGLDDYNKTALFWYKKAADSGHAPSQFKMFWLLLNGKEKTNYAHLKNGKPDYNKKTIEVILAKDKNKALHYLKLASDNHHPGAMNLLARGYQGHRGWVPKNKNKSLELYKKIVSAIETDMYSWHSKYPWNGEEYLSGSRWKLLEHSKASIKALELGALSLQQSK